MRSKGSQEYRTPLTLDRGGVPRRVFGARQRILRDGHTLAVQTLTDIPATIPEGGQHWAYEIRRGRMTVYGGVLRFLDVLHRRGVPKRVALMIPGWIEYYVEELWSDGPQQDAEDVAA